MPTCTDCRGSGTVRLLTSEGPCAKCGGTGAVGEPGAVFSALISDFVAKANANANEAATLAEARKILADGDYSAEAWSRLKLGDWKAAPFQIGDRVTCHVPGSWVDGRVGTVLKLDVRDEMGEPGHFLQMEGGTTVVSPHALTRADGAGEAWEKGIVAVEKADYSKTDPSTFDGTVNADGRQDFIRRESARLAAERIVTWSPFGVTFQALGHNPLRLGGNENTARELRRQVAAVLDTAPVYGVGVEQALWPAFKRHLAEKSPAEPAPKATANTIQFDIVMETSLGWAGVMCDIHERLLAIGMGSVEKFKAGCAPDWSKLSDVAAKAGLTGTQAIEARDAVRSYEAQPLSLALEVAADVEWLATTNAQMDRPATVQEARDRLARNLTRLIDERIKAGGGDRADEG